MNRKVQTMNLIQRIGRTYEVNRFEMQIRIFRNNARTVAEASGNGGDIDAIVEQSGCEIVPQAMRRKRFDSSQKAGSAAEAPDRFSALLIS